MLFEDVVVEGFLAKLGKDALLVDADACIDDEDDLEFMTENDDMSEFMRNIASE